MGCGSSGHVVHPEHSSNGHKTSNGTNGNGNGHDAHDPHDDHDDSLPTVVLPDTPAKPKPPIAYEIPLEEFESGRKPASTPPPHLQRLLHPPATDVSLPDIREKLAEAEMRRQTILQQRAASAQKRSQKMMKNLQDMEKLENEIDSTENMKHVANSVTISPEPRICQHKII